MIRLRLDKTGKPGQSVSDRNCNLNCIWCHGDYFDRSDGRRPAISNGMFAHAVRQVLAAAEAEEAVIRLAGDGEPTLSGREELAELIELLHRIPQVRSTRMTTNGVLLKEMICQLRNAGLDGVTISLNSLDREIYRLYAGADHLNQALDSICRSVSIGLATKVNVIYSRLNDREIDDFVILAQRNPGLTIKFFDLIPTGPMGKRLYLPLSQLEGKLAPRSLHIEEHRGAYASREYYLTEGARIQVKIAQVNDCPNLACYARSNCLEGCRSSVRIRLDGFMQPCGARTDNTIDLFSPETTLTQIRGALKSGGKL